jgi:hypothetical protein
MGLFVEYLFAYFGWTWNQEFFMHTKAFSKKVQPCKYKAYAHTIQAFNLQEALSKRLLAKNMLDLFVAAIFCGALKKVSSLNKENKVILLFSRLLRLLSLIRRRFGRRGFGRFYVFLFCLEAPVLCPP